MTFFAPCTVVHNVILTTATGAFWDPATLQVTVSPPAGAVATIYTYPASAQIVRNSAGNYTLTYPATVPGCYAEYWEGWDVSGLPGAARFTTEVY